MERILDRLLMTAIATLAGLFFLQLRAPDTRR